MRTLMMTLSLVIGLVLASTSASAQPDPGTAAPPSAGSAAVAPAADGPAADGPAADAPADDPPPTPAPASATPTAAQLRQTCADAMNADPTFADSIVKSINEDTYKQHARAAAAIAKNERHVVLAYGAMWVLAVGFVLFLWRRQQALKTEIVQLRRDLDAAAK